jgi:glycosyltransferase involved in cell wall biosynthesis
MDGDSPNGIGSGAIPGQDDGGAAAMDESSFLSPAAAIVAEHVSRLSHELSLANDELRQARWLVEAAEAEAERAGRELERAEDQVRALIKEISTLRAENATLQQLCVEYITAKEQLTRLRSALEEIFGQRSWKLLKEAGALRTRLNREQTLAGRCWRLGIRLLRGMLRTIRRTVVLSSGALRGGVRWSGLVRDRPSRDGRDPADRGAGQSRPPSTFSELPWRRLGDPAVIGKNRYGSYKILLIGPGDVDPVELDGMLRLAEGLSRCGDLDCRIILEGRSDVADAFARIIPTLELDAMLEHGIARVQASGMIADLFQQAAHRRIAVIHSAASADFFSACASRDIDVITWLAETIPTTGRSLTENPARDVFAGRLGRAIGTAGTEGDAEAGRSGIDPGRARPIRPGAGDDHDGAWTRFHAEFLRILEDEFEYHPACDLKVSVIVPNYNHARYLEERLRSIFAQTHRPHEILFLDDASSDESVAVARRLAAESPVPFHLIPNETNSGSTFRQWLKGIDLACGDLVWIAESDDVCRPELLERLVPEFFDPAVALAYCQSAMIGPEGQKYAEDYVALTNDISVTHWRHPYSVPALEEVELALSQRNTIPNASAVVFRKRADIDCRADLERMRLGGDWLFYATQIRGGRISFVADVLNSHRHHDRTVRHAFERAAELVEEQLHVKARIFESYPITADAISRSVSYTVAEYVHRKAVMGLDRPALTSQPKLEPSLARIRSALRARRQPVRDLRVLMVLSAADQGRGQEAAIRLANKLAGYFHVFLCNACPWTTEPRTAAAVDERITLIEGTLGMTFWVGDRETRPDGTPPEAVSSLRSEVIGELIRLHRIDVIHSRGWWADRLVAEVKPDPSIPWFIDLCYPEAYREDTRRDPEFPRLVGTLLPMIRGVFYAQPDDLGVIPATSRDELGRVVRIFDGFDPGPMRPGEDRSSGHGARSDRVASLTAEAYLATVDGSESHDRDAPRILRTA